MRLAWLLPLILLLTSCTRVPEGISPVSPFTLDRYLGSWYEIARLDHGFESGLTRVTAQYALRDDGGVDVINRGYNPTAGDWEEATGKAYFVEDANTAHLKVSFFGPFYASYVVFELDPDYQYAFISGPSRDYLWLLARTPEVSDELKKHFIASARQKGFAVDDLIFVEQQGKQDDNAGN
jgi:apolipoprotein D and lipocalin family protein